MEVQRKYTVSLDKNCKRLTIVVIMIMAIIALLAIFSPLGLVNDIIFGAIFFVVGIFSLFTIRGYILADDKLMICRLFPILNKSILISDIKNIRLFTVVEFKNSFKRFGSDGGPFGYMGTYNHDAIGDYMIYATNMDKLILLKLKNDKKIAISPDDLGLMDELLKKLH
jgi:hypothetical protein